MCNDVYYEVRYVHGRRSRTIVVDRTPSREDAIDVNFLMSFQLCYYMVVVLFVP